MTRVTDAHRNLFITLEGIDGAGKSSVVALLARHLGGTHIETPSKALEEERAAVEKSGGRENKLKFYVHAMRWQQQEIEDLLCRGHVVCDRYIHSTLAYQWPEGAELPVDMAAVFPQIRLPDYSFLLTVRDDIARQRIAERERRTNVVNRNDHDWIAIDSARERFLRMPGLINVDTSDMTPEEVCSTIVMELGLQGR